jgi:chromosomal replication initiator protein
MKRLRPQLQLDDDPRRVVLARAWRSALKSLSTRVNRPTFEGYIRQIEPKSWEEGVVTLAVPSAFAREWLRGRYVTVIQEALESALGNRVSLHFVVEAPRSTPALEEMVFPSPQVRPRLVSVDSPDRGAPVGKRESRGKRGKRSAAPDWLAPLDLSDKYSLDRFVPGATNRMALAAAQAVSASPGSRFNPLVLVGPSGVGKSHLLHAVAGAVRSSAPSLRIGYVDGESYTFRYYSGDGPKNKGFRDFCDGVDVWLVDDIQFIADREEAREEFYHTLNELTRTGRQVVLSSDRPPSQLPLGERVRTRLEGGLVVEIGPPELETRMTIVERTARELGVSLPGEIAYFVANGIRSNVRSLEGAVTKLFAYCQAMDAPLTVDVATEVLAPYMDAPMRGWTRKGVSMEAILNAVSEQFGVPIEDLRGERLDHKAVRARQAAMYLCRQFTEQGYTRIGQALGGRDHATVKRGIARMERLLESDLSLRAAVTMASERTAQ